MLKTFTVVTWNADGSAYDIMQMEAKERIPRYMTTVKREHLSDDKRVSVYVLPTDLCTETTGFGLSLLPIYFVR